MINDDIGYFFAWLSDMRTQHMWWTEREISSYEIFEHDFRNKQRGFFGQFFTVVDVFDRVPIGFTYIYNVSHVDQYAYTCIYLIPEKTGQGLGCEVANIFGNYLFGVYKFRKFYAEVFEFNQPSLKLLQRNGFVEEARLSEYRWYDNKYWDLIILSITRESFSTSSLLG